MAFGMGDLSNSGTMPISGGQATSGNGDQKQNNSASFGGLNYGSKGISPLVVGLVVLTIVVVYTFNKK